MKKSKLRGKTLSKADVIKTWHYKNGRDALDIETKLLNHYRNFRYTGDPILETCNTELFNHDVMGLDKWN